MSKVNKAIETRKLQSPQDVSAAILEIGKQQARVREIENEMNAKLATTKDNYEAMAGHSRRTIEELSQAVHDYCHERRADLEASADGKKSIDFGAGEVCWRKGKPSVWVKPGLAIEKLIAALKEKRLGKFIRTKHELDKQAVLKSPEAVAAVKAYVRVESKEQFAIKPFATQIEQVL